MQHFQEVRYGSVRKCLWLTLENPGYSIPSKLFSLLSIGVVLTSIATMCINSIPEYQVGGASSSGSLVECCHLLVILHFTRTNSRFAVKNKTFCCPDF